MFLEYGSGKLNVRSYKRAVSRAALLTHGYSLPPGYPDTTVAVDGSIDTSLAATYGVGYGVVAGDLVAQAMRVELAAAHVAIRKQPRQVITVATYRPDTPRLIGPSGEGDYNLGDLVTGRAVARGAVRFDAAFRVYQVAFDIDDAGDATPSIDLIPNY